MKTYNKIALTATWILAFNATIFGQETKESGIYFGAIIGTKYNDFNRHFNVDINPELYSFSIGAGSAWTKNNYVIGFEFLYSSAQKDNIQGEIQYIGFSNTLSFGYNLSANKTWKLEPNVGVVLDNNQLISQNISNNTFQNLTNNQISGSVGLNIKMVGQNGLFTGVKIGYNFPFSGETAWEDKITGSASDLRDNVGSFYLQLNLGGLLDLTKSN